MNTVMTLLLLLLLLLRAKRSVARGREPPSVVTYGNSQQTLTTHISLSIDFRHIVHVTIKVYERVDTRITRPE